MWNGGVLTTKANLLFQGTGDARLVAYRADSGERLWEAHTQTGVVAAPISYEVDGIQYVAVMAGWGGAAPLTIDLPDSVKGQTGRLLVYRLYGEASLPDAAGSPVLQQPPEQAGTTEMIARGLVLTGSIALVARAESVVLRPAGDGDCVDHDLTGTDQGRRSGSAFLLLHRKDRLVFTRLE